MATLTLTVSGAAMALARQPIPQVPAAAASAPLTPPPPVPQHVALKPLADLVGDVESKSAGGYNAANNGYAMGLGSHGLSKHFGTDCKNISVGQIIKAQQRGWLYAVGRYQMIPSTLAFAVKHSPGITNYTFFTPETQDTLFLALLKHKRPAVWAYLNGKGSRDRALHALALEWAGLPGHHGYTLYPGNNASHTSVIRVRQVLEQTRQNFMDI
ncbi:predicted protein [Cyanophage PSS2]|nr:predicted protein [Cyanophage PSS2]